MGIGGLGLLIVAAVLLLGGRERRSDAEEERQRLAERTAWSAYLRQSPVPLRDGFASGSLDPEDAVGAEERREDFYAFEAADSSAFTVVATAAGFTPDLIVTTPEGGRMAGSGLRQTARRAEVADLRGPGRFVVTVTSREPEGRGAYELSVGALPTAGALRPGETLRGTLGDGMPRAGRFETHYTLLPRGDDPMIVTVAAETFRPHAYLLGPEGEVAAPWGSIEHRDDDDGRHLAVARFQPSRAAPYTLIVTSEEEAARGSFTLDARPIQALALTPDGIAVGGTLGVRGWLRGGRYVDAYRFDAPAGSILTIEVGSGAFAPSVTLKRTGRPLAGREGVGSVRIETLAEDDGPYEVEVSSIEAGRAGDYTISVYAGTVAGLLDQQGAERVDALMASLAARLRPDSTETTPDGPAEGEDAALALDPLTGRPRREEHAPEAPPTPHDARIRRRAFSAGASGVVTTRQGHAFEVTVGRVEILPAGDDRFRVRLRVSERSANYTGPWGTWANRARQTALVDDTGRAYRVVDVGGGNRPDTWARAGDTRQGLLVFEGSTRGGLPRTLELRYPLGRGATASIPFRVPR